MTTDLDAIRAHARQQRKLCQSEALGDRTLAELWAAILHAANDLDPPLHKTIKKGPQWTTQKP